MLGFDLELYQIWFGLLPFGLLLKHQVLIKYKYQRCTSVGQEVLTKVYLLIRFIY